MLCGNYDTVRNEYKKIHENFNEKEVEINQRIGLDNLKKINFARNFSNILEINDKDIYDRIKKTMLRQVLCEDGVVTGVSAGPVPQFDSFSFEEIIEKYFFVARNILNEIYNGCPFNDITTATTIAIVDEKKLDIKSLSTDLDPKNLSSSDKIIIDCNDIEFKYDGVTIICSDKKIDININKD